MATSRTSAAIWRETYWDPATLAERPQWRVQLSDGPNRRRLTRTRREAIEWCEEFGYPFVLIDKPER